MEADCAAFDSQKSESYNMFSNISDNVPTVLVFDDVIIGNGVLGI